MRLSPRHVVVIASCLTLAACADISGLDQIQESLCAPDGCSEAGVATDPTSPLDASGADGTQAIADDAGSTSDAGGQALSDDGSASNEDSGADAFSAADAGSDVGAATDAAVADAPAVDASHADASPADSGAAVDGSDAACGTVYFADSFDDDSKGWTLGTNWSIAEECASPPAPQKGNADPTTDHTGTPGSGVVGAFVCGNNPSGQTLAAAYAESPAVDTSAAPTLKLGFWRWLNTDSSTWVASTIDVYNGSAWVNVYTNPAGSGVLVTDAAWTYENIDVTAEKNAAFRVRFGYAVSSASAYSMSAWNVDDVSLSSSACE